MRSACKAAGVEEGLLLRPGGAAQRRVAVREPPEAADDVGMSLGVFRELIVAVAARECDAAFLIGDVFRVLERQIEELICPLFLLKNSPYVPLMSHRNNLRLSQQQCPRSLSQLGTIVTARK